MEDFGPERPVISGLKDTGDGVTRVLHQIVPLSIQKALRDHCFRAINDCGAMALALPLLSMRPSLLATFLRLGSERILVPYGGNALNKLHIFPCSRCAPGGPIVVFVHGGAWGSGRPWMYRLVAEGLCKTLEASAMVVVEYQVYPEATILQQRDSVLSALRHVRAFDFSTVISSSTAAAAGGGGGANVSLNKIVLCGHSSGANVCALALLDHVMRGTHTCLVDAFISLSGVFDIAKHYRWERSRGVHIVSPMAAAAVSPTRFHEASPTLIAARLAAEGGQAAACFPATLVLHGAADVTVPITSSIEFANALRQSGVKVSTAFPNDFGHADPLTDLMSERESATSRSISSFWHTISPIRSRL